MNKNLKKPMYVILANRKQLLYLGFKHSFNYNFNIPTRTAQGEKHFAFLFETAEDADDFIEQYFKDGNANPKYKNFYEPILVDYIYIPDTMETDKNDDYLKLSSTTVYNIKCFYSTDIFLKWRYRK